MNLELVTICWNAAETLSRTLESVLAQRVLPHAYRIVDGGSTDGTLEILERFRPRFEAAGVQFSVEPQQRIPGAAGIPSAWNQALQNAQGDIVGLLNADDWYDPGALQSVVEAFQADEALDAVSIPVQMHHADPAKEWLFVPQPLSRLPWKMPIPHPGTFFHRRVYEKLGLYDIRYRISADYDFVWRCYLSGVRWKYLPEALVHMQLGGVANASRKLARRETYRIARSHSSFFDFRPALAFVLRTLTGR